jgi:exopolyphosphatase
MKMLCKLGVLATACSLATCMVTGSRTLMVQQDTQLSQLGFNPRASRCGVHRPVETGVGHFSEWSRETKRQFLIDWQKGRASEWIIVQGNEGGDMDSMTAAITWAYHLQHSTQNSSSPVKAIALLQTPMDALDLRPENQLALANSLMSSGHSDLLTIDELPEDPETLSSQIRGIVIVDHPVPLTRWRSAAILSIFDHHEDRGAGPDANPRVFEKVASCTSLVARRMLDELEALPAEYHMPHELLELILSAIAIDSSGLDDATEQDREISARILERSNWRDSDLYDKMDAVNDILRTAKKDLDDLGVRDLLRRDWKGDFVDTAASPLVPRVSLGFSSIPYSLDAQIAKTEFEELFHWFAVEAAWTAQVGADVSVALNKYKVHRDDDDDEDDDGADGYGNKTKVREIVLVVRRDMRLDGAQADDLFRHVCEVVERDQTLEVRRWYRAGELGRRQMVWTHENEDAGRKVVRPIIEAAVRSWKYRRDEL